MLGCYLLFPRKLVNMQYNDIITFWFESLTPKQWWLKDADLDTKIALQFTPIYQQVVAGKCAEWREYDEGRLAEIIVLDQFSRNIFRNQATAFSHDAQALALTDAAVQAESHQRLAQRKTNFLLMPYMHSESLEIHRKALHLFEQYASENTLQFERRHLAIIERFGRYPHRNELLGRSSTPKEKQFLTMPDSAF